MIKFIQHHTNPDAERTNTKLINKEYDEDLIEYIIDCCHSLETIPNIKFIGYDFITDERSIDINKYIAAKKRGGNKKNEPKRSMYLKDSRYEIGRASCRERV